MGDQTETKSQSGVEDKSFRESWPLPSRPLSSTFRASYDNASTSNVERAEYATCEGDSSPAPSLAAEQTTHSSDREAGRVNPHASIGSPPSTAGSHQDGNGFISRSVSLSSDRRVGSLTSAGAQQTGRDEFSRSHSLRGELQAWISSKPSSEASLSRAASVREQANISRRSSLATLHENGRGSETTQPPDSPQMTHAAMNLTALPRRLLVKRHSSLRHQTRPSDDVVEAPNLPSHPFGNSASDPVLAKGRSRPRSLPPTRSPRPGQSSPDDDSSQASDDSDRIGPIDPWRLPPLPRSMPQTPRLAYTNPSQPPSLTFKRLSSLDQLITYREDRESWKRESYISAQQPPSPAVTSEEPLSAVSPQDTDQAPLPSPTEKIPTPVERDAHASSQPLEQRNRFRHVAAEVGFCFTIAMTQLLAEYLISGFAIVLPNLFDANVDDGTGATGLFWPAALLSLILSAFSLFFARVSDMYGGYGPFMFGLIWLTIWTLVPGFVSSSLLLNVSRAMQGFAIAAFTPSTFSMVGSIYPEGPRRNFVLGLYGACAPLGFFAGFLAGGALPETEARWYFWIASALAFITTITAYLSVPYDRTDRRRLNLKMDWLGAFLITSGLILVTYALSVQPYANAEEPETNGFAFRIVYAPLASGTACLLAAFWVEGWYASCPLLPFEFFKPQGVKPFSIACLFFYGSFGVWLYNSAEYFVSPSVTEDPASVKGIMLSLWYTPMAVGGIIFCVIGSSLLHIVPIKILLILSGLAWIGAPLVFAVGPIHLSYWSEVLPSMICGTLGIDLTFTIAAIFLSSSQPLKFQGVAGAVSSILVNLAMSFSLPLSLIVKEAAAANVRNVGGESDAASTVWGFRAAFIYGAVSAGCGLLVCIFFVRISRSVVSEKKPDVDEERPRVSSSSTDATFVPGDDGSRTNSV